MSFRASPRILCDACYDKKSMRFPVDAEFCVDALEVIARSEQSLKPATLVRLRELIQRLQPVEEGILKFART